MITDTLLDTTASVCRILSRNESHILLAGPTGSCRIDAIYISCTFLGVKLLSITPLKNYNINDFYNDLKMVKVFLILPQSFSLFVRIILTHQSKVPLSFLFPPSVISPKFLGHVLEQNEKKIFLSHFDPATEWARIDA